MAPIGLARIMTVVDGQLWAMREIRGGPGTPYGQSFVYAHVIYETVIAYVLAQGSMGIVEIDNDAAVTMLFELKDIFDLCSRVQESGWHCCEG